MENESGLAPAPFTTILPLPGMRGEKKCFPLQEIRNFFFFLWVLQSSFSLFFFPSLLRKPIIYSLLNQDQGKRSSSGKRERPGPSFVDHEHLAHLVQSRVKSSSLVTRYSWASETNTSTHIDESEFLPILSASN